MREERDLPLPLLPAPLSPPPPAPLLPLLLFLLSVCPVLEARIWGLA